MKYAAIVKAPRQCKSFSSCSTCRTAVPGRDPSGDGEDSRARTATAAAGVLPSPPSRRHLLEDFCSFSGCQERSLLRQLLLQCARQGVVALAHRTDCRVHRRQLCHRKKNGCSISGRKLCSVETSTVCWWLSVAFLRLWRQPLGGVGDSVCGSVERSEGAHKQRNIVHRKAAYSVLKKKARDPRSLKALNPKPKR